MILVGEGHFRRREQQNHRAVGAYGVWLAVWRAAGELGVEWEVHWWGQWMKSTQKSREEAACPTGLWKPHGVFEPSRNVVFVSFSEVETGG